MRRKELVSFINKEWDKADKKYHAASDNYQLTGSGSTYRTMHRYDLMSDVFKYALDGIGQADRGFDVFERQAKALRAEIDEICDLFPADEAVEKIRYAIKRLSYFAK
ncbi:MAG: hypothetical protein LBE35_01280 [Clostridiales bacterium]|nr:hypothetical protein [Clostridiales bacterium]